MSDRLTELQRQRAIIHHHLAWLDQEISAATGKSAAPAAFSTAVVKPATPVSPAANEDADTLLARFGTDSKNEAKNARKGCFLIFILGLVLFGLSAYALVLYTRNRHENDAPPEVKSTHALPTNR